MSLTFCRVMVRSCLKDIACTKALHVPGLVFSRTTMHAGHGCIEDVSPCEFIWQRIVHGIDLANGIRYRGILQSLEDVERGQNLDSLQNALPQLFNFAWSVMCQVGNVSLVPIDPI